MESLRVKKVAFVAPFYPVLTETFIQSEVASVQACGHDVVVFAWHKRPTELTFSYDVIEVGAKAPITRLFRVSPPGILRAISYARSQELLSTKSLMYHGLRLAMQFSEHGVEHVHSHFCECEAAYTIMAAKLLGISCSFVGHGHDVYEVPQEIDKKLLASDFAVAVCEDMRRDFLAMAPADVKLLHCGVQVERFSLERKEASACLRLIFVGRLVFQKGVQYLLEALASLAGKFEFSLDIVGDGDMREDLEQQAKDLALAPMVSFLGAKSHAWVRDSLASYDCMVAPFCFTETGCVDTGPLVLKEAMLVGTPVISSNIMGCKEIVAPGTGYLVNEKNVPELAARIAEFSELSTDERAEMGQAARQHVLKNFDALKQAKKLSSWIQGVSGRKSLLYQRFPRSVAVSDCMPTARCRARTDRSPLCLQTCTRAGLERRIRRRH